MTSETTIDARFAAFHEANPIVYETLVKLARDAVRRGRQRIGVKALVERVRWEFSLATTDVDFKISNTYASRYARLIAQQEPDLANVFEFRELRAA